MPCRLGPTLCSPSCRYAALSMEISNESKIQLLKTTATIVTHKFRCFFRARTGVVYRWRGWLTTSTVWHWAQRCRNSFAPLNGSLIAVFTRKSKIYVRQIYGSRERSILECSESSSHPASPTCGAIRTNTNEFIAIFLHSSSLRIWSYFNSVIKAT